MRLVTLALIALLGVGCSSKPAGPDLAVIYNRAAMQEHPERNPVIVIPGILGSRLETDDEIVWGAFGGGAIDPSSPRGARTIGIPMREGATLAELTDEVYPAGVLDRLEVNFLGLPIELNAYFEILSTLGVGGYRDEGLAMAGAVDYGAEHFTCFQFDYDWRRDIPENASRLEAFIEEKRVLVQSEIERRFGVVEQDVEFDIVAHSMGGLVTRWMLRYGDAEPGPDGAAPPITWAGAEHIEHAILVGTPNAGSVDALVDMTRGVDFVIAEYQPGVLGTMPSIYQLLPRERHGPLVDADTGERLDPLDADLWIERGWGLADPRQDDVVAMLLPDADAETRRRIAIDHLRKCLTRARGVADALDTPADPPAHTQLHLIAGDAVSSRAVVSASADVTLRDVAEAPGDGTVLRSSALLDERTGGEWMPYLQSPIRWSQVTFLFEDHLGLTKDPAFADNVLFLLLDAPRPR